MPANQFEFQRGLNQVRFDLQQLDGERHQFVGRQAAMALVHRFGERIGDAGANADHRRLLDAEPDGDRVGSLEADAADVACQTIGIVGHDLDGIDAIGLVDPDGARRADAMAVQEDHDLADDLLLRPGRGDALGAHAARCQSTSRRRSGSALDDVEHLLAEGLDHLLGVDRADAADHAGGEILLDALDRAWCRGAHEARLELLAMGAVVDPFARRSDPLTGRDRGSVANNGHEVAVAARLYPQHAEAVLGIVEGDPLDDAGDYLAIRLGGGGEAAILTVITGTSRLGVASLAGSDASAAIPVRFRLFARSWLLRRSAFDEPDEVGFRRGSAPPAR